ncbi:protein of unknown function [Thermosyntropha lipolytica DSM 11003]|uniref:DUF4153 domain-containing protein n=1 Tax=Thermosyntropha lipolytica DSM 11003 TaxID=1123382 RepID=A0A1M5MKM4_9FIRM|nr:DUF4153 domain-containing protein [Thermosyntropha lipolytica]SHG77811.1 protein of unknown function [Thermosyntropha lipolytica DSM 11003]
MEGLWGRVIQLTKDALNAFKSFPAAMVNALAFAIVTIIRINIDWPQQELYNFLFNCLHLSLALGAVFSLTAITAAQRIYKSHKMFMVANGLGLLVPLVTFFLLYYCGRVDPLLTDFYNYPVLSELAAARVTAAMLICFLGFVVLAGDQKVGSDLAKSLFMILKAFFIALIYGGTIMAGLSAVAGAVQVLLYSQMSEKVYLYLATISGFISFAIFVGYFPDFTKDEMDFRRQEAEKQPRFVEVLFSSILIPLMLAMTLVLLLWTVKSLITGVEVSFTQLSSIATTYALGGLLLHIMVTHHESSLAGFYRRFFPYAALIILAFEARAFWIQLGHWGLKTTEYWFGMIWILSVCAAIILIVKKDKGHRFIAELACILALISVLPMVGYHDLSVKWQVNRLESLLVSQGMLTDGKLVAAVKEPELAVREAITDALVFLVSSSEAELPPWLDRNLINPETFKTKLGFEQAWPQISGQDRGIPYPAIVLQRPLGAVDISQYKWAVTVLEGYDLTSKPATVESERGLYRIYWLVNPPYGLPTLRIVLNDKEILKEDMKDYIKHIIKKYPPDENNYPRTVSMEDMSVVFTTQEIKVLLVFDYVEISVDPQKDIFHYSINPHVIYLQEKT